MFLRTFFHKPGRILFRKTFLHTTDILQTLNFSSKFHPFYIILRSVVETKSYKFRSVKLFSFILLFLYRKRYGGVPISKVYDALNG